MEMDYKIVICSHNRITALKKKTLATLESYNIPKDKIFIFVAEDEEDAYRKALDDYLICPGEKGLHNQRNAVTRYFGPDEHLFCLDDDITGFFTTVNKKLARLEDLDAFVRYAFQTAVKEQASLWSIYPVKNGLWMKNTIQKGLVFCYGCCFGVINKKDVLIERQLKEDYERSMKFYLRDKKVLRFNWVTPAQSYRRGKGGLSEIRTDAKELAECEELVAKFPEYIHFKKRKERCDLIFVKKFRETVAL